MKKPKTMRGLSDVQLVALIESLPAGMALLDVAGRPAWSNRVARRLLSLRATTSPDDVGGSELGDLCARLVTSMSPFRGEESARWTVASGGFVVASLRRLWGSQTALWMTASADVTRAANDDGGAPLTSWQLVVAERMLHEARCGLVVANRNGGIDWLNLQAGRLLGGRDAEAHVARAARHLATGRLTSSVRMHVELPTRAVEAQFWNVAPGLAGVLFGADEEARAPLWRDRLIA